MKKSNGLFPLFMVLISCAGTTTTPTENNHLSKEIVEKYESASSLLVQKNLFFDDKNVLNTSAYLSMDINLKGYVTYDILQSASSYNISSKMMKEYILGSDSVFESDDNQYVKQYENCSSTWDYLGYQKLWEDAKNKNIQNHTIQGTLPAEECPGIVRSFIYGLGNLSEHFENYYFNSYIHYSLFVDEESKTISSMEFDLFDIAKRKKYNVNQVKETVLFVYNHDVSSTLDKNPFPEINQGGDNDNSNIIAIQNKGIEFIEDCYGDIQYVSDSLTFYPNTILSTKLSFSYTSSRPDVIGNDGTYYPVLVDTSVTLTVDLKYASNTYAQKTFTFLAIPPINRSGELGSLNNPIYQGRKQVDDVKIYFIEMHKQYGDSIYIEAGDFDMLIDAGNVEDGPYVNDFIRRHLHDGRLDFVLTTHAHGDHIGGMLTALSTVKNMTYAVDYGYLRSDYSVVNSVRNKMKIADKYAPILDCVNQTNGARKDIYITQDLVIHFLNTGYYHSATEDLLDDDAYNSTSVTFYLSYKNHNFYFAGDLESPAENSLLKKESLPKMTLAKASHHGSSTSNTDALLSKINPGTMVVSTALVNRGSPSSNATSQPHPNYGVYKRMLKYAKVYCNFTTGTLEVTSDGNSPLKIRGMGISSPYYINGQAATGEENLEFRYTKYANRYYS